MYEDETRRIWHVVWSDTHRLVMPESAWFVENLLETDFDSLISHDIETAIREYMEGL
jgi:hypothetical protein